MKLKQLITILLLVAGTGRHFAQDAEVSVAGAVAAQVETAADGSAERLPKQDTADAPGQPSANPLAEEREIETPAPVVLESTVISNLFAAYINAIGGERALTRVKSRVVKGTYETGESKADFEIRQSRDGSFLSVTKNPGNTSRTGFDGEIAWKQSGESDWTELPEAEAEKERFSHSLTGILGWQEFYSRTRLLPGIEINGRPVKVVLAENDLGVSQKIYFDEQNNRVVRLDEQVETADQGRVSSETYFKDYRTVDDVVVHFLEETILPDATLTKRVRSVEHNIQLEPGLFSPPKAGQVASSGVRDTERFFNSLTIGGIVYTNVWVHRQTNFNVLIRHAQGIHTIKLTDLPKEDLAELRPQIGDLANIDENRASVVVDQWGKFADSPELQRMVSENTQMATEMFAYIFIPFILGWLVGHLIWSYIIKKLCDRTQTKGGLAVWIPFVQLAPMFRAAGFSDKWLGSALALLVVPVLVLAVAPLAGLDIEPKSVAMMMMIGFVAIGVLVISVASVMWPFKICSRCKKSPALGLLMFVPGVNIGMMLYLAFSEES